MNRDLIDLAVTEVLKSHFGYQSVSPVIFYIIFTLYTCLPITSCMVEFFKFWCTHFATYKFLWYTYFDVYTFLSSFFFISRNCCCWIITRVDCHYLISLCSRSLNWYLNPRRLKPNHVVVQAITRWFLRLTAIFYIIR